MTQFQVYVDKAGEFRWRFLAANGQVIATSSEGYKNKADCEHGLGLVKKEAPTAKVEDMTKASK
jgi:uncharacterized protein